MSLINTAITKQPYKLIEIPLNKFENEAMPHHTAVFEMHKSTVQKHINLNNIEQLEREIKDKKRIVRQLKDLMYELDTLRTQVEDCDLNKFDGKTLSLRKILLELISSYNKLENQALNLKQQQQQLTLDESNDNNKSFLTTQLQIQEDMSDLKLKQQENTLEQVDALKRDIQDVHEIFTDLNQMVAQQQEGVTQIESNVEATNENVTNGLRELIKASRLKKASYPVAGAFIGTIVGGPIGSVAGLKIGGLAAVVCGFAGYIGGKFAKKANEDVLNTEIELNSASSRADNVVRDKKDM